MPKTDYGKTIIYKIQHKELNELLYIGSTTHFRNRKTCHKSDCYNTKKNTYNYKLYKTIRENGGWDMFNMILVKEHPCENKRQKEAEEDKVMREMKASLNMMRAYTTHEEKKEKKKQYRELHKEQKAQYHRQYDPGYRLKNQDKIKEYMRKYRLENKDHLAELYKQYNLKHKEQIAERGKHYRLEHKDEIAERGKHYRLENKEKLSEKINCACGGKYAHKHKSTHFKTKIHQAFINNSSN